MDKSLMLLSSMVCDGNTTTNRQQIIIASTGQFAAGIIGSARSISDRLQKKKLEPGGAGVWFLLCCMECRCSLAMRILSVRPSACQLRAL